MTNKRRRGTGHIYKQPGCSTWTIQYYRNAKRVREATGLADRRAAQQRLTQRLHQIDKGEYVAPERRPVLLSELFEGLKRHYLTNARKSIRILALRWRHLSSFLASDTPAVGVTYELLERYTDRRLVEGASNATINREIAALRTMFRIGLKSGRLKQLPLFPHLVERNVRKGFIEDDGYRCLIAGATELWLRLLLELAYTFGWRRAELLGLKVRQVNLKTRSIRLDAGETKNSEAREVVMTATIFELMRQAVVGKNPDDFVLTRENRKPVRDFRGRWAKLCRQAGLPGLLLHDFRRSAARQLRSAGNPESVIMTIGGWKTAAMFRRYAIVSNSDVKQAITKLEEARANNSHDFGHDFPEKAPLSTQTVSKQVN
jgi:integrase